MNEFVIVIVADLMFFASDLALDGSARQNLGWSIVGVLGLSIVYSQGSLIFSALRDLCKYIRNYYTRWRNRKNLRQQKKRITANNKKHKKPSESQIL